MPYIKQKDRQIFEGAIQEITNVIMSPGELNYVITRIVHGYVNLHGLKYDYLNDAIGVLESAKLEVYRTIVADYENLKRKQNGDV